MPEIRARYPQRYLWVNTEFHVKHRDNELRSPRIFGVMQDYPIATNRFVASGRFLTETDVEHAADVVVIGDEIRERLFPREDALNKAVQLGHDTYVVVGILEHKGKMFGESNDNILLIPITTFDRRFPWIKVGGSNGDALRIASVPSRRH